MLWKRSEGNGSALHVRQQIPVTHEKQGPSDQAEKPDGDPGFPAGDCCFMPPGAVATPLIIDLSLLGPAVSVPDIHGSAGTRFAAIIP